MQYTALPPQLPNSCENPLCLRHLRFSPYAYFVWLSLTVTLPVKEQVLQFMFLQVCHFVQALRKKSIKGSNKKRWKLLPNFFSFQILIQNQLMNFCFALLYTAYSHTYSHFSLQLEPMFYTRKNKTRCTLSLKRATFKIGSRPLPVQLQ